MAGIRHVGAPGGPVIFLPDMGYMGVSLFKFRALYPYDLYSFCVYIILSYTFY